MVFSPFLFRYLLHYLFVRIYICLYYKIMNSFSNIDIFYNLTKSLRDLNINILYLKAIYIL